MTIRHRAFSAVRWTALVAASKVFLQLAQVAVLARLLAPEDFGLMAMVAVVLGFGTLFSDMGINSAYVQRTGVTPAQRSSLFWLNILLGGALTSVVLTLSPVIAGFFGDARLAPLLMAASTTFCITALGQQLKITAEKALDFRPVACIEVAAALSGFVAALIAAYSGLGVYALVIGVIANATMITLLAWLILAKGWRPMWRFRYADIPSFLGFGGALVASNLVNEVSRSVDLLIGGRMLAASTFGLYSLPRQLVFHVQGAVNPIITRVGFPLVAQLKADKDKVQSIYLKTLNMTAATNAPLYLGVAFFAPQVITIMLGDKWLAEVDLLRILAIWGFVRSTGSPVGSLLLGMGRADLSLKWNLVCLCLLLPILWFGVQFGSEGLAWSLLGFALVMFIPGWFFLVRPLCHASLVDYLNATIRPLLIATISIVPAYVLTLQITNPHFQLVIAVLISAPLYLGGSFMLNREWWVAMLVLMSRGR